MSFAPRLSLLPLVLLTAASIGLSGCGEGATAASSGSVLSAQGTVHGGQAPIQGSTVRLYHTDPSATTYGAPGILIGSTTSDSGGNFNLGSSSATSTNCPAGTQAYITAAGGFQAGQSSMTNNNMLMMATLGDCSTVSSSTIVNIDEVTTVAAAYALSGFTTTTLNSGDSFYTANVSAPIANSTAVGSTTLSAPAGLAHAFLNAAKLVNISLGMPNTTTSASTGGATVGSASTTTFGSVPYTEILTLADIMQSCVDSPSGNKGAVSSIAVSSGGSGYGATLSIGSVNSTYGSGATGNVTVTNGVVTALTLTNGGSGYSSPVTVANGTTANPGTGAAIIPNFTAGALNSFTLTNGGSGYGAPVTVTDTSAGKTGTGAVIYANVTASTGAISSYTVANGGSGYTSGSVTVTVAATGTTAGTGAVPGTATVSSGKITAVALGTAGTGYAPALSIPSPTTGTPTLVGYAYVSGGVLYGGTVSTAGSGYGPTVTITGVGGSGSGATATANTSAGIITALTLGTATNSGYPTPSVAISAPTSGTTASATTTVVGGAVTAVNVTNPGSGYTSAPAVAISAPTSGTTATATAAVVADSGGDSLAPSTACNSLFAFTPSISGVRPVNTLQAFINLARNPYPSAAAMSSTSGLLTLAPTTPAFVPVLTAAPTDWSLSIVYGTTAANTTALAAPYWLSLDQNDVVYVGLSTESATGTTTPTPALYGVGSYNALTPIPTFGSLTAGTASRGIAPDGLGNIWIDNNSNGLYQYNITSGAIQNGGVSYTSLGSSYGLAVDAANNVWVSHVVSSGTNMDAIVYTPPVSGTGTGTWASTYTASFPGGLYNIAVDANQNVWGAPYYSSGTSGSSLYIGVISNTGTPSAPVYTAAGVSAISPVVTQLAGGAKYPYSTVFDASGNAWYDIYGSASASTSGVEEVVPTAGSAGGIGSLTAGSFITGATTGTNGNPLGATAMVAEVGAIDGAGTMFIPDNDSSSYGVHVYSTVTGNTLSPANGLKSCVLTSSTATTCGATTGAAIYNPRQAAIDSTGSLWVGITTGGVTQVIGVAAPSYPQLSVGKPGLSPGLTAANPLP